MRSSWAWSSAPDVMPQTPLPFAPKVQAPVAQAVAVAKGDEFSIVGGALAQELAEVLHALRLEDALQRVGPVLHQSFEGRLAGVLAAGPEVVEFLAMDCQGRLADELVFLGASAAFGVQLVGAPGPHAAVEGGGDLL